MADKEQGSKDPRGGGGSNERVLKKDGGTGGWHIRDGEVFGRTLADKPKNLGGDRGGGGSGEPPRKGE